MLPSSLVQHCKTKSNKCYWHRTVLTYLQKLYSTWWDEETVCFNSKHHYGLHQSNTPFYNIAYDFYAKHGMDNMNMYNMDLKKPSFIYKNKEIGSSKPIPHTNTTKQDVLNKIHTEQDRQFSQRKQNYKKTNHLHQAYDTSHNNKSMDHKSYSHNKWDKKPKSNKLLSYDNMNKYGPACLKSDFDITTGLLKQSVESYNNLKKKCNNTSFPSNKRELHQNRPCPLARDLRQANLSDINTTRMFNNDTIKNSMGNRWISPSNASSKTKKDKIIEIDITSAPYSTSFSNETSIDDEK